MMVSNVCAFLVSSWYLSLRAGSRSWLCGGPLGPARRAGPGGAGQRSGPASGGSGLPGAARPAGCRCWVCPQGCGRPMCCQCAGAVVAVLLQVQVPGGGCIPGSGRLTLPARRRPRSALTVRVLVSRHDPGALACAGLDRRQAAAGPPVTALYGSMPGWRAAVADVAWRAGPVRLARWRAARAGMGPGRGLWPEGRRGPGG
jgi:hypothetical protein